VTTTVKVAHIRLCYSRMFLVRAYPRERPTLVVLVPENRPPDYKALLPNGGSHFWSRQAYSLGYRCQREDRFSRLQRRAAALNRQLGGEA